MDDKPRCAWPAEDPLMLRYHDEEWGVPVHDDRLWFELIALEAFQAGLSWRTVLYKRDEFRKVFHDFVPEKVARMTPAAQEKAMLNAGIIRNRQKIDATVKNAKALLALQKEHGSFDTFIWSFTDGKVVDNRVKAQRQIPAATPLSDQVSKALKKAGFSFVGTTIVYALLQATGVVNDHLVTCYRHGEVRSLRGQGLAGRSTMRARSPRTPRAPAVNSRS
jgi:DNA-3-methyladenine glycosylase I